MVQRLQFEKILEYRNSFAYIASTRFLSLGGLT